MPRFYNHLPAALADGQPFALGIISGIKGSSPQKKGAKALFFADGRIQGTLGGGCLEA
jgi:xanthine dehydrogenase accessory factor